MAKYKKYAEYQDSGAQWLGEVPNHWGVEYSKWLFEERNIKATAHDEMLTASQKYGVIPQKMFMELEQQKVVQVLSGHDILKKAEANDFVISMRSFQGGIEFSEYSGAVSSAYVPLKPREGLSLAYYKHLFKSAPYIQALQTTTNLVRDGQALRYGNFIQVRIPLVPLEEAEKIGQFLDYETAQIDSLIAKQEKLIELLKEKRQAVISHAVTKGLNPDVKMKDSGVEWLGQVPEHWVVSLVKYQCKEITDGAHISPDLENGEHFFVSIRDIKEGIINFEDALLTSTKSYQYLVHTGCKPFAGDILFSKDGTIGQTAITPSDIDFVVASSLIIIRPKYSKITSEFLDLLLRSDIVQEQVESFVKGAALRRLSIQNLLKIWGVFPPIDEQRKIVEFVLYQLDKYKDLEAKAEKQVELLRERRTALISSAVTGKIDVRNWQHPNEAKTEFGA